MDYEPSFGQRALNFVAAEIQSPKGVPTAPTPGPAADGTGPFAT
jgi:hypothetical protein